MSDVKTFIDAIGADVNTTVAPKVKTLAETVSKQTFAAYGPRISAFAGELVKEIIDEQSGTLRDFVTGLIEEVCHRYQPELTGELHATMVPGAVPDHRTGREARREEPRDRRVGLQPRHSRRADHQGGGPEGSAAEHQNPVERDQVADTHLPQRSERGRDLRCSPSVMSQMCFPVMCKG